MRKATDTILPMQIRWDLGARERAHPGEDHTAWIEKELEKMRPPRCAGTTVRGRPCRAFTCSSQTPFCHNHVPRVPVEFVGGGPLDGLCFYRQGFSPDDTSEVIGIGRTKKGKVVICEPDFEDPRRCTIGAYRYEFHNLIPEWRWEPTVDA